MLAIHQSSSTWLIIFSTQIFARLLGIWCPLSLLLCYVSCPVVCVILLFMEDTSCHAQLCLKTCSEMCHSINLKQQGFWSVLTSAHGPKVMQYRMDPFLLWLTLCLAHWIQINRGFYGGYKSVQNLALDAYKDPLFWHLNQWGRLQVRWKVKFRFFYWPPGI